MHEPLRVDQGHITDVFRTTDENERDPLAADTDVNQLSNGSDQDEVESDQQPEARSPLEEHDNVLGEKSSVEEQK